MNKLVKLLYVGKTEKLIITWKELERVYTFDREKGHIETVLYDDAKILLSRGATSFKVVSGVFYEDGPEVAKKVPIIPPETEPILNQPGEAGPDSEHAPEGVFPEQPPNEENGDPGAVEPVLTGDGVEGTGDMPPVEETPTPEPEEKKKGGKKGNK